MPDDSRSPSLPRTSGRRRASSSPNWLVVAIVLAVVAYSALKSKPGGQEGATDRPPEIAQENRTQTNGQEPPSNPPLIEGTPAATPANPERNDTPVVVTPTIPSSKKPARTEPAEPSRGVLRETRSGVFESSAGLIYRRGGAQGHRLDHVLEHAKDDRSKPVHGVFLGDRDEILALIDEAWETAQKRGPPQVKTEQEGDRTVYTINLNRKIGYLGGQSGGRRNHPPLNGLRLVLEDREVITAFPVAP